MEKSQTKERLLDATLRLISEKGYLRATTKEIAREAGVTELTLFRHFGSKENLFEEVLKTHSFMPQLEDLLQKLDDYTFPEAMKIIGIRFFTNLQKKKSLIRIMNSEINLYPEKVRKLHSALIDRMIHLLADYLTTMQKNGVLREAVRKVPLDRILLETDCPYLTPVPYRGRRNEPAYLRYVAEEIAQLKRISVGEVAERTTANAVRLFDLTP